MELIKYVTTEPSCMLQHCIWSLYCLRNGIIRIALTSRDCVSSSLCIFIEILLFLTAQYTQLNLTYKTKTESKQQLNIIAISKRRNFTKTQKKSVRTALHVYKYINLYQEVNYKYWLRIEWVCKQFIQYVQSIKIICSFY